jgi:class 3 adenylate cyclase
MHPEPASGTLTFLFTDLEGSTRLWEEFPHAMKRALERHDAILRAAVAGSNGQVAKTMGDGMMAIFRSAAGGVSACLTAQRGLVDEPWGETGALRVRMGLHSGEAQTRTGDYFGPTVNRTARIMAVGHGGQVLLSSAAAALVLDQLPDGHTTRQHPEWTARFEVVRPYPRQLLRVIYYRSDGPGSDTRLDASVVQQLRRLREVGFPARFAT